jgi:hypothetical protein
VIELIIVGTIAAIVLVVGYAIGMLAAPHIARLAESDEEPRDGDDPATD